MKRCNQCSPLMINGLFCHESGCPNESKNWEAETEEWVNVVTCFECGGEVKEGEACECQQQTETITRRMQVSIGITGSGTRNQIATRLLDIARTLENLTDQGIEEGQELEDGVLITTIKD